MRPRSPDTLILAGMLLAGVVADVWLGGPDRVALYLAGALAVLAGGAGRA